MVALIAYLQRLGQIPEEKAPAEQEAGAGSVALAPVDEEASP
jgi:hypothetical protein